jgi:exopolysaccharide biosynthesis polyprenyl glycosylphosphotransferase
MNTQQLHALPVRADRLREQSASLAIDTAVPRSTIATLVGIRVLDVLVAACMLLVCAVPMLLLAVLIRLTSTGPAIYRQVRTGLNGRPFVMFKFRTMRVDAEEETGPVWARHGDARCTQLGSLLRRLSIDELPQLINVLRGDMSLVGPRPERPYFVQKFSLQLPHYSNRLLVPPGITGWAQVNGWRGDTSLERRLDFDIEYVRNRSFWLNLRILLWTPIAVLAEQNWC